MVGQLSENENENECSCPFCPLEDGNIQICGLVLNTKNMKVKNVQGLSPKHINCFWKLVVLARKSLKIGEASNFDQLNLFTCTIERISKNEYKSLS